MADGGWFCRLGRWATGIDTFPVESCDFRPRPYRCGQAVAESGVVTPGCRRSAARSGRRATLRPVSGSSRCAVREAFGSDVRRAAGVRDCVGGQGPDQSRRVAHRPVTAVHAGRIRARYWNRAPVAGKSTPNRPESGVSSLLGGPQYPSRRVCDCGSAGEAVPGGTGGSFESGGFGFRRGGRSGSRVSGSRFFHGYYDRRLIFAAFFTFRRRARRASTGRTTRCGADRVGGRFGVRERGVDGMVRGQ